MVVLMDELTSPEFAEMLKRDPIVILPIGAVEGHGPHLPLGTDSIQPEALARRLSDRFGAIIAPPFYYGECSATRNFPGTLTISFDTLRTVVLELVGELCRNGVRKVLVLSGHAGRAHMIALREAGKAMVRAHKDLRLMVLSDYEIAYELMGKEFDADDGHGGTIETSRIMQLRPDLVKGTPPKAVASFPRFMVVDDPESHIPQGYWGDPTKASETNGQMVEDYVFKELERLIEEGLLR